MDGEEEAYGREVSARIALRLFPLVFHVNEISDTVISKAEKQAVILQVFRANFICWAVCYYTGGYSDSGKVGSAAENAHRSAKENSEKLISLRNILDSNGRSADDLTRILRSARSIEAALGAAVDAKRSDAAAMAAERAGDNSANAPSEFLAAIKKDREWVTINSDGLIKQPLWLIDVRGDAEYRANLPPWAHVPFDKFANSDSARTTSWGLIAAWYRAILPNSMEGQPSSPFSDRADIEIATQPDEFWTVTENRLAEQIVDEIAEKAGWEPPSMTSSQTPEEMAQNMAEKLGATAEILQGGAEKLEENASGEAQRGTGADRHPTIETPKLNSSPIIPIQLSTISSALR